MPAIKTHSDGHGAIRIVVPPETIEKGRTCRNASNRPAQGENCCLVQEMREGVGHMNPALLIGLEHSNNDWVMDWPSRLIPSLGPTPICGCGDVPPNKPFITGIKRNP
jgi:hypothetical protein